MLWKWKLESWYYCDMFCQVERVRQVLSLREKLCEEQRLTELGRLDRSIFTRRYPLHQAGFRDELDTSSDDNLLSPKERLRCANEMEKSVDCSLAAADQSVPAAAASTASSADQQLIIKCINAMKCNRASIPTSRSVQVCVCVLSVDIVLLSFSYLL
jgi:hypothetical protein